MGKYSKLLYALTITILLVPVVGLGINSFNVTNFLAEAYTRSTEDSQSSVEIPDWIRNNAKWWSEGKIEDNDFAQGIQFLISKGIMKIPETKQTTDSGSNEIPSWVKNNAGWWADGLISDDDFVKGIQYLIEKGIIRV